MTSRFAFALAAICLASSHVARAEDRLDMCDFKPIMNEDFSSLVVHARTLDGARWTAHTPWNGDFGDARFVDPGPNGPFTVKDGALSITASRAPDGRWRSGLLAADADAALAQAERAQKRMSSGELGAEAYIRRHVELSKELLAQ